MSVDCPESEAKERRKCRACSLVSGIPELQSGVCYYAQYWGNNGSEHTVRMLGTILTKPIFMSFNSIDPFAKTICCKACLATHAILLNFDARTNPRPPSEF